MRQSDFLREKVHTMNVTDFNFELPQELIAQDPLEDRAASRLLVLNKETGNISHRHFRDIRQYLKKGDCLVINDTKVIPARLIGHKGGTDAKIEVLLLKRKSDNVWETLVKPGKKMKEGAEVSFGDGLLKGTVVGVVDEGNRLIQFEYDGIFEEILDQLGQMPLPPYITHQLKDKNRYQTVYAKHGAPSGDPGYGRHHRPCDPPCGPGNLPARKGGHHRGAPHAFGVLCGGGGRGEKDQRHEKKRRPCDLCGHHQLPYPGVCHR